MDQHHGDDQKKGEDAAQPGVPPRRGIGARNQRAAGQKHDDGGDHLLSAYFLFHRSASFTFEFLAAATSAPR